MSSTVDAGIYQAGEKPFDLTYQFRDSANSPLNLTGYTASMIVVAPDGTQTTPPASVTDAANGVVGRAWTAAMTDQPGLYRSWFTVTNGTYTITSRSIKWVLEPVN